MINLPSIGGRLVPAAGIVYHSPMTQQTHASSAPAPAAKRRFSLPVKIGLIFGALGLLLTVVGIARGQVPLAPANILVALLLGGGVWFIIAWAVATAAVDVENDAENGTQNKAENGG